MRISLQIPSFTWGSAETIAPTLRAIAQTAEANGFYSLWVMDHFFQISMIGPAEEPMLEAYSALSYLAAVTERVRLGALVTGVIYRHPGVLAKTVTTLDVLSGGRAYLGIGAAWFEREALALGIPYPPVAERFERLEEALQIIHQMWSANNGSYTGRHYQLAETLNSPQPISRPHPPVLIGGSGEKKTLRLVAQYADACNLFVGNGLEDARRKLAVLRAHCDALGRDYASIEKTALATFDLRKTPPAELIATLKAWHDAGFEHIIFNTPNVQDLSPLETFGREIIPAAADLQA
ncbi:LLM class F420-dependent oxidoreductase [Anaerolineae bacterium CFX9]|nr:LLM class F420-dependent oxidoreductase [Anaerolineae bacterium CFX9]